jgi:hypothetical protein
MNKAPRILTMTGLALVAGAAFGSAPAVAAPAASSTGTTASTSTTQADLVVHHYRSYTECRRAGRVGRFFGRWDRYSCDRVWFGRYRGWFALSVDWDWHGNGGGHGDGHGHWHWN